MLRSIWQDARYALRHLRTSPVFALTAVSVLALGRGANVAVLTLISCVMLRPLSSARADAATINPILALRSE